MNLASAIDELKHRAREMRLPDLRRFIMDLKPDPGEVEPYIQFTENHYARNLVYKASDFECLAICWLPGQRSPIHDHGKSICTVYALSGVLSADNYKKLASGHVRPDYSEDFAPGSVLGIQTTEIHQVSNLQGNENMVSLHFYVGPLENSYQYSIMQPNYEAYRRDYTRVFTPGEGI